MGQKMLNYNVSDLHRTEVEYKVPTKTKVVNNLKFLVILGVGFYLFMTIVVKNINKIGTSKSDSSKRLPVPDLNYTLTTYENRTNNLKDILPTTFISEFSMLEGADIVECQTDMNGPSCYS